MASGKDADALNQHLGPILFAFPFTLLTEIMRQPWALVLKISFGTCHPERISGEVPFFVAQPSS
jgi:hypothetical protein